MTKADTILDFLKFSEKLKTQKRDNLLSNGDKESVADHSWHVALMALLIAPELKTKVDLLKVFKMIIIHDLVEAELGDVPFSQSFANPKLKAKKRVEEEMEIKKIEQMLGGATGREIHDLFDEYEKRESREARFVKALDSLEANYQGILFGSTDYWDDVYYTVAPIKCDEHCVSDPILEEINQAIKKRMLPLLPQNKSKGAK